MPLLDSTWGALAKAVLPPVCLLHPLEGHCQQLGALVLQSFSALSGNTSGGGLTAHNRKQLSSPPSHWSLQPYEVGRAGIMIPI